MKRWLEKAAVSVVKGLEKGEALKEGADQTVREAAEVLENKTADDIGNTDGLTMMPDEESIKPVILEPGAADVTFRGGLSACNYKCISSYCYPVDIARGINSKNPHGPNSAIGHT